MRGKKFLLVVFRAAKDFYGDYNGQCSLLGGYAALIWPLEFCGRCDNEELFSCSFRLPRIRELA